ncbi:MAG: Holliday junction branch migration protein RuvA [Erysipelotrichaceae bacterium]|nr:Holliday junction branch migration protein RuvA [Erysipelotrichaceae bacterium]
MITFINGTVYSFGADYVILDNNGIGYYINFMHPEVLSLSQQITIFTYQHFREDGQTLYGFIDSSELELFKNLISVKGLGPKTAQTMLGSCKYQDLINAIELGDVAFLKRMPSIGSKTAQQIILDLKGKLVEDEKGKPVNNAELEEAYAGLKALGYKAYEINSISGELKKMVGLSADEYLKAGLKLLIAHKGV